MYLYMSSVGMYLHVSVYVYLDVYMYVYVCVYVYLFIYVCVYVCMGVYISGFSVTMYILFSIARFILFLLFSGCYT